MHKKTLSKILVSIIITAMLTTLIPILSVGAVTLTSITPNSGNVGTTVRLLGTIDTLGGEYTIGFDTDSSGSIQWSWANETVANGNAPVDSYTINTTWVVPDCLGSDAGLNHMVALRDEQTLAVQVTYFRVITLRETTPTPTYVQEGDNVTIFIDVTAGTLANELNRYTVKVINPNGVTYTKTGLEFTTDDVGTGQGNCTFPVDFSTGASTALCGEYTILVDRVLPGAITNATAVTTFTVGIAPSASPSYSRFDTVQVKTSGWATNQLLYALISYDDGTVVDTLTSINASTGTVLVNWTIPKDAELTDYNMKILAETGSNKTITSSGNFTVNSVCNALAVHIVTQPTPSPQQRTLNVTATFYVTYPDGSNFTAADAAGVRVLVYRGTTAYGGYTASLQLDGTTDYDPATDIWTATWTVLKTARCATNYNFRFNAYNQFWPAITDIYGNLNGPSGIMSSTFTVQAADLDVQIVNQTSPTSIQRKQTVTAGINITWPDGTAFTGADLGTSYVRVYNNGTIVDTVTLAADDYNATSNIWTISWTATIDAPLGIGYNFTIIAGEITGTAVFGDASNPNAGSATINTFNNFTVTGTNLIVPFVDTIEDAYLPGEYVIAYFNATYVDGSPVTTGTSTITMTAPDGYTTLTYHPMHASSGMWQVLIWLSDAQAQVGVWDVELAAYAVDDGAGNLGPTVARTAQFTVLPANVTLSDVLYEIDVLKAQLAALEANTTTLSSCCGNVTDLVNALQLAVNGLEADINSLSSTAASASSVTALSNTVNQLSTLVNTIQTNLNSLASTALSADDLTAITDAVAALQTDLTALETATSTDLTALSTKIDELEAALDALSSNAATNDDLVDAKDDLAASIGSSNMLIIVAIVLALVAAVAAIAAVYIILKKIAG